MSTIDDLQTQFREAQAAAEAYSAGVTAKYRREMPDPAEWSGPGPDPDAAYERAKAWTEAEREHLDGLRKAATAAAVALHRARQEAPGHTTGD